MFDDIEVRLGWGASAEVVRKVPETGLVVFGEVVDVGDKIRQTCILAEEHGYDWVWIDTCYIDKTSSTDLSEAINSMFLWYSYAEICYAYLDDVPSDDELDTETSAFRRARWHTRGRTLQELIAPSLLLFISQDWVVIGDKIGLASLLSNISGIRRKVITRESHFTTVSVAGRMSWASNRQTTRLEDEAYCLMGLFAVHMPTIYGEGRQAFQRLQHQIMQQRLDTTLFAWGRWMSTVMTSIPAEEIYKSFATTKNNHIYLLAKSPHDFEKPFGNMNVYFTLTLTIPLQPYLPGHWKNREPPPNVDPTTGPFGVLEVPRFQLTNYGVECRLPVFESGGITIAVLFSETRDRHIGLLLHPSTAKMQDAARPKYHVGHGFRRANGSLCVRRLVALGADWHAFEFNGERVPAGACRWRDLFIADAPPARERDERLVICYALHCLRPAPPFWVPHWLVGRLAALGLELRRPTIVSHPSAEGEPLLCMLRFQALRGREAVQIVMGTCDQCVLSDEEDEEDDGSEEASGGGEDDADEDRAQDSGADAEEVDGTDTEELETTPEPEPTTDTEQEPEVDLTDDNATVASGATSETEEAPRLGANYTHPVHWARVSVYSKANWNFKTEWTHDCETDHVDAWPGMSCDFGDDERTVRLSFARSPVAPEVTVIAHIDLLGTVEVFPRRGVP
ncbi:uncharacterized protein BXZ73DRAFT_99493 [Epithele typhae]|uniref:uncharacterized protein n=1 Tax=Epithele typhae TaxID=378194 RepID=UPI0020073A8C|nr:uncharacterized protein BXZ73DRAFT_99493 [Epithele typhae]KAH9939290.1 hypothetical protein BXZ73DRAFT_99493 [Epithele typhae]